MSITMSKAVMISIRPKWCELIANGEKTIEIRKTRPKLTPPFKCYIYESQGNKYSWNVKAETIANNDEDRYLDCKRGAPDVKRTKNGTPYFSYGRMSVIGEFVCNFIYEFTEENQEFCGASFDAMQLTPKELSAYANGKTVYGWHISDLVIYDRPKELNEFLTTDNEAVRKCEHRFCGGQAEYKVKHGGWIKGSYMCTKKSDYDPDWCEKCKTKPITRPPQSWCYVEQLRE